MALEGKDKHLTVVNNYNDARNGELVINTSVFAETQVGIAGPKGTKKIDLIDEMKARVIEELGLTNSKVIYGFCYDSEDSNPETNITYTDDAVKFNPIKFRKNINGTIIGEEDLGNWTRFIKYILGCKPCLFQNGILTNYLDPNDYTKDISGSDISYATVPDNFLYMIEFNKVWYKLSTYNQYIYFKVANYKVDDTYTCDAFIDAGTEKNKLYLSIFPISRISNSNYIPGNYIGSNPLLFNISLMINSIIDLDTIIANANTSLAANNITADLFNSDQYNLLRLLSVLVCKSFNLSNTDSTFLNNPPIKSRISLASSTTNRYAATSGDINSNNYLENKGLFSLSYNTTSNCLRIFGIDWILGDRFKVFVAGLAIKDRENQESAVLYKNTNPKSYQLNYTAIGDMGFKCDIYSGFINCFKYCRYARIFNNKLIAIPESLSWSNTSYLGSFTKVEGNSGYSYMNAYMISSESTQSWSLFNTVFTKNTSSTSDSTAYKNSDNAIYISLFK